MTKHQPRHCVVSNIGLREATMSRSDFWIRIVAGSLWALLVLGALRSEPVTQAMIGEQLAITHQWCGA